MPILTTFAGAAARVYGLGGAAAAPVLPANTILMWSVTDTSSVPTGWAIHTASQGKFFMGANTLATVGNITSPGSGSSTLLPIATSSAGAHYGATFSYASNSSAGSTISQYSAVATTHAHTATTPLTADAVVPDAELLPVITNAAQKSKLPPNTIVFRKTQPTSLNFISYTPDMPSSRLWCGYKGGSSKGYANSSGVMTGSSAAGGSHSHLDYVNTRGSSYTTGGSTTRYPWVASSAGGSTSHTHANVDVHAAITLKSKTLTAWVSLQEEDIEYGMIVMCIGPINSLPPGWRVCDGTLGTPDMVGWYLGRSTTVTTHGDTISTITIARSNPDTNLVGATTTETWTHGHQGTGFTVFSGTYTYHDLRDHPHYHTVSVSGTAEITNYDPGHIKVAFIQYKGI